MIEEVPYGAWPSPITSALITRAAARVGDVRLDGEDVWWQESRPEEGGRIQVVCRGGDGLNVDVLPDGFSARTRVHEYGGGAWTARDGVAYFTNWTDQRLYRLAPGGEPEPLTPEPEIAHGDRYADMVVVDDWVLCVREHHPADGAEAINEIVAIPRTGGDPVVLVTGSDFVSSPRVSPDGTTLAWLQWDHPRMPWDGTELYVAPLSFGAATIERGTPTLVAGGLDEAICLVKWHESGTLHFCSDRDEWWNIHRFDPATQESVPVTFLRAEIGVPHWVFGQERYDFLADGSVVFAARAEGIDRLWKLEPSGELRLLDLPYTAIEHLVTDGRDVYLVAASTRTELEVICVEVESGVPITEVLRPARDLHLDAAVVSVPEAISFPSEGGRTAHALYYPPMNPVVAVPSDERPPLIVEIHGGPTSAARPMFNVGVQYWTSRGFGVVDVNYGGSTGYGRSYRRLLDRAWGIVDVEDCIAAARYLADRGSVDGSRLCITGGSAGGFTTLAALCFSDVFSAGASHFGVADLAALATDTHKFESRYLDRLVGPYPEDKDVYDARSPIHHVDTLDAPLIVFQGLEDEVVPPNQAEMIVEAVRAKGVPVAYVAFEGEQHGFRKAENIRAALDGELAFYGKVFGFIPPGDLPSIDIANLD